MQTILAVTGFAMLLFRDFPAYMQLMLLASRTHLRDEERERMVGLAGGLVAGPVDWVKFLEATVHHRLSSLVFAGLDAVRPAGLPEEVRERLQQRARENAFEALRAAGETRRIAQSLAGAGVEVIALKGVALSQLLYGSANARHVGDIDLLDASGRADKQLMLQIERLAALGYVRVNPAVRLTPRRIAAYVRFWKDATFRNATTGFELDLHWRLFNNRGHGANRMLKVAHYEAVTVLGVPMRVLSLREQFIYCAAHGTMDAWTSLKGLADVAAFLRRLTEQELGEALERAEELGLLAQVSAAVHLANDWMGCAREHAKLLSRDDAVAVGVRERAAAMLVRRDFLPVRDDRSPREWLRLELELVPGLRSRLEALKRHAWRPRVWEKVDLPDGLFWMYPVVGLLLPPRVHRVGGG